MNDVATVVALITTLAGIAGCSGQARCSIDQDCFAGEICAERVCSVGTRIGGDADIADDAANTTPPDEGLIARPDAGRGLDANNQTPDAATSSDSSTADAAVDDAGHPDAGGVDAALGQCTVDPFTFTCSDDSFEDNDTWINGERLLPQTLGCNPDFVAHDSSYIATMCPLDGSDWYYVNFFPCADSSYVIEWQVQLESDCDPSVIAFEPLSYKCDEPFVDCTTVDGKPTIRMIVSTNNFQNLQSTYVQVTNRGADVVFDYRIRVSVRR